MEICRTDAPPSVEVGTGHEAACWLHADGGAAGGHGADRVPMPTLRAGVGRTADANTADARVDPNMSERKEATGTRRR
jgi:hypothetical protein